jgi:hypothetical protein
VSAPVPPLSLVVLLSSVQLPGSGCSWALVWKPSLQPAVHSCVLVDLGWLFSIRGSRIFDHRPGGPEETIAGGGHGLGHFVPLGCG